MPDACIIELGGTVGDIESAPYVEALRQFQFRAGPRERHLVHVSLVPVLGPVGEQKTKPTQHTVKELAWPRHQPDILVCRSSAPLNDETSNKLAAFCHVKPEAVMSTHDVPNIYHVPLMLQEQGLCDILNVDCSATSLLQDWKAMAHHLDTLTEEVHIAMVGKYTDLSDAYLSVIKSFQHAAMAVDRKLVIDWIEARVISRKVGMHKNTNGRMGGASERLTASSFPAGSATVALKEKSGRHTMHEPKASPTSASASGCKLPPSNSAERLGHDGCQLHRV